MTDYLLEDGDKSYVIYVVVNVLSHMFRDCDNNQLTLCQCNNSSVLQVWSCRLAPLYEFVLPGLRLRRQHPNREESWL